MRVKTMSCPSSTADVLLMLLSSAHYRTAQVHLTMAALEWGSVYFTALFPLTFHSELRRGQDTPEGAGQEETHLLDA